MMALDAVYALSAISEGELRTVWRGHVQLRTDQPKNLYSSGFKKLIP